MYRSDTGAVFECYLIRSLFLFPISPFNTWLKTDSGIKRVATSGHMSGSQGVSSGGTFQIMQLPPIPYPDVIILFPLLTNFLHFPE